ncbi:MAG: prolyl oligopeptidase family serine peptidase [Chitinophagaceae bacterium]
MKKVYLFFIVITCMVFKITAQDKSLYKKHWFLQNGDTMPYRVLLPKNFDTAKRYPFILFLHGAGERGSENELQLVHGSDLFLKDNIRESYPAIVVFPQCAVNSYWSNVNFVIDSSTKKRTFNFNVDGEPTVAMKLLLALIKDLQQKYHPDKNRMYVGGLSMGGMGTFELVRREPKLFTAALSICGGANSATANKLKHTSWWIFHGLKDDVVNPEFSKIMAKAIKQQGAEVKLTLYPNANHNSWDSAFAEKDLMAWLFAHHKK